MIEIELEFDSGSLKQVVMALLSLPAELRPSHHSLGEDEKGEPIFDPESFVNSLEEQPPGPYLTGQHSCYYFSLAASKSVVCRGDIDLEPTLVRQFMIRMASLNPRFGFACIQDERYQRNRVTTRQGVNTIESWVGRDIRKYVPGFYWVTLLPDFLAKQHDIPLSAVAAVAQEYVKLENGQHMFRFYEQPEDWKKNSSVTELCASLPGVFSIEKVKPKLSAAKNFLDLNSMLRDWK